MAVLPIGITGATGFLGGHLNGRLRTDPRFAVFPVDRGAFASVPAMAAALEPCEAVIHFAGLSRHADGEQLYRENCRLAQVLGEGARQKSEPPHVFFVSTTHVARDTPYHASKRDGAALLRRLGLGVTELLLPNVFGPYSRPFYNSVVSTFCALAASGGTPEVVNDVELHLTDVFTLSHELAELLAARRREAVIELPAHYVIRLPELWRLLQALAADSARAGESALARVLYLTLTTFPTPPAAGVQS